ncbi:uncharacterized protein TNCV_2961901 [Trichonephila clavipes]|nr:uncharacterized protein TNCV_2961901 [Trichonephila clavipes]
MTKRTNCFLHSLKKGIRDHRWPTCSLFVMNIGPTFREMMTPFCYILLIHNVPINRNNFIVNIRWSLTFSMKKTYDGAHIWRDFESAQPILNTTNTPTRIKVEMPNDREEKANGSRFTPVLPTCSPKLFFSSGVRCARGTQNKRAVPRNFLLVQRSDYRTSVCRQKKGVATSNPFTETADMLCPRHKERIDDPFLGDTMSHLDNLIPYTSNFTTASPPGFAEKNTGHCAPEHVVQA